MTSIQASLFDPPPGISFGTPAADLVRHNATDTSVAAAARVNTSKWERLCYEICIQRGVYGVTNAEAAHHYVRPVHAISGRWSALIEKGLVFDSGLRRDCGRVLVAVRYRTSFLRKRDELLELQNERQRLSLPRVEIRA